MKGVSMKAADERPEGKFRLTTLKKRCERAIAFIKRPFFELICVGILALLAAGDFLLSGVSRRTIVFYAEDSGALLTEERFIAWQSSREEAVRVFVEEITLGPSMANTAPLLGRGTRLETCFLRGAAVTIEFSEEAALLPVTALSASGDVFQNLRSIRRDITRNFGYVKDVRFFIAGEEIPLDTVPVSEIREAGTDGLKG
jgi:hypothetical protein